MQTLDEKIRALPPEMQEELENFVDYLLEKRQRQSKQSFKLRWRGAMRDLRDTTSVELQHKATEWRIDDVSR